MKAFISQLKWDRLKVTVIVQIFLYINEAFETKKKVIKREINKQLMLEK